MFSSGDFARKISFLTPFSQIFSSLIMIMFINLELSISTGKTISFNTKTSHKRLCAIAFFGISLKAENMGLSKSGQNG